MGLRPSSDATEENQEDVQEAMQVVPGGGTGFEADGTGLTLYKAIAGPNEAAWMTGAAQRSLSDMPYIQVRAQCMERPCVDMNAAAIVATLSIHNQRPDSDTVQIAEITDADISIYRYRPGTDAGFVTVPVNDQNMTVIDGGATYAYAFPNASWATGDRVMYVIRDVQVTINSQVFEVPFLQQFGEVIGAGSKLTATITEGCVVEENAYYNFAIQIVDKNMGNIAVGDIDITGMTQGIVKSTGGGAFNSAGLTVPSFAKAVGTVTQSYQFLAAEWAAGDMFRIAVNGVTATIDGQTVYLPEQRWCGIVLEAADQFANIAAQKGATGILYEQVDTAVTINAISGSETDVFDLNTASTRYVVRSLRLKAVDPGVDTIIVRLRELINDVSTVVDSFNITTANFGVYHSLMDMFGVMHLSGDDLQMTVQTDNNTYAVTGQYSHAKTNN